jgi:hypothetical protein
VTRIAELGTTLAVTSKSQNTPLFDVFMTSAIAGGEWSTPWAEPIYPEERTPVATGNEARWAPEQMCATKLPKFLQWLIVLTLCIVVFTAIRMSAELTDPRQMKGKACLRLNDAFICVSFLPVSP